MRTQKFRFQTNLPSPARRGSRSRPLLRRPRPLRFQRLRVPVWNPYSRGRLGLAKSEDRKGGEGKTDANLTIFFSTCSACRSGRRSFDSKHLPSPARRGSRSRTASPPASLAIRKAPSASVESIQPRPPQPCEVGRPKGRRRKNRRQSHNFFLAPAAPAPSQRVAPQLARHDLGRASIAAACASAVAPRI